MRTDETTDSSLHCDRAPDAVAAAWRTAPLAPDRGGGHRRIDDDLGRGAR